MSTQNTQSHQSGKRLVSRRSALGCLASIGIGSTAFQRALAVQVSQQQRVTAEMIQQAEWVSDTELSEEQRESVARVMTRNLRSAAQLRDVKVDASVVPALIFRPDAFYDLPQAIPASSVGVASPKTRRGSRTPKHVPPSSWPQSDLDLAFASIGQQSSMLAAGDISSRKLTQLYLERLKQHDPELELVITLLEEDAVKQADASDSRRRRGVSRGVLDGIPWLAKDLLAVPPHKTTWGAEPFKEQVRDETATVVERLDSSGAVLLAKVSLGALAWGDEWFGGKTRNPWNTAEGSSGSSAGSAAGVAAGLGTFAIGSETLGSIVSPTRRCRTSGLRGTFGRVSRHGCMPLAWSMDKIGPIARHVDDLAWVFDAIHGPDARDPTLVDRPFFFPWQGKISDLRVGVTGDRKNSVEQQAIDALEAAGAKLVELDLTSKIPVGAMSFILGVEAASVFEDEFRGDPSADYGLWNDTFCEAQFYPAVQYVRANRLRGQLIHETEQKLRSVDCVIGANDLLLTNLTGHPSIVVSCGSDEIQIRKRLAKSEPVAGADTAESNQQTAEAVEVKKVPVPGVVKMTSAAYQESTLLGIGAWLQQKMPPAPVKPTLK